MTKEWVQKIGATRRLFPTCLILFCVTPHLQADELAAHSFSYATNACATNEKWVTQPPLPSGAIEDVWILHFSKFLQGKSTAIVGFSQALALRRLAAHTHDRVFSEYWISRALFSSGMAHLAESGFKAILNQDTHADTLPFQLAALSCLNRLRNQQGVYERDERLALRVVALAQELAQTEIKERNALNALQNTLWESAVHLITATAEFQQSSKSSRSKSIQLAPLTQELLSVLKGAGPYEALAQGLVAIQNNSPKKTTQELEKFLSTTAATGTQYEALNSYKNFVYLSLGRAYYSLGQFQQAANTYRKIEVRSNEWVHALSELSWSYLMIDKYPEAIGVGAGVQAGALKRTFSPETLMVGAMAFNEMCYFPESLKMVKKFRIDYAPSYAWLKNDLEHPLNENAYYKLAIAFARNTPDLSLPGPIGSEWIRSPVFLTNQETINLLIREKRTSDLLTQQGLQEQKALAEKLIADIQRIKETYTKTKIKLQAGQSIPQVLVKQVEELKKALLVHQQVKNAAPIWRRMLANFQTRSGVESKRAVTSIAHYISRLNQRMMGQLEEIAANQELMEVEIFNGASEDMVWQNAHPDFHQVAQKIKHTSAEHSAANTWNWGNSLGSLDGQGEIWEDEVGSITANLHDNCENKAKYLEIKREQVGS